VHLLAVSHAQFGKGRGEGWRVADLGSGRHHRQGAQGRAVAGLVDAHVLHASQASHARGVATVRPCA